MKNLILTIIIAINLAAFRAGPAYGQHSQEDPATNAKDDGELTSATVDRAILAIKRKDVDALKSALGMGDNANASDNNGTTLLMWAVGLQCKECFELLIARGADPNQQNYRGESATSAAAGNRETDYWLKLVLKHGGNPNLINRKSRKFVDMYPDTTPLFDAVEAGNVKNVDLLLKAGAKINQKHGNGYTPLVLAAITNGREEMVYHLIRAGADINAVDSEGRSVVEIIEMTEERFIIDFTSTDEEQKRKNEASRREWHRKTLQLLKERGALIVRPKAETRPKNDFGLLPKS